MFRDLDAQLVAPRTSPLKWEKNFIQTLNGEAERQCPELWKQELKVSNLWCPADQAALKSPAAKDKHEGISPLQPYGRILIVDLLEAHPTYGRI